MTVVRDILFGKYALKHGLVHPDALQGCLGEQTALAGQGQSWALSDLLTRRGLLDPGTAHQLMSVIQRLSFNCASCGLPWSFQQLAEQQGIQCLVCGSPLNIFENGQVVSDRMMTGPSVRNVNLERLGLSDSTPGSGVANSTGWSESPGTGHAAGLPGAHPVARGSGPFELGSRGDIPGIDTRRDSSQLRTERSSAKHRRLVGSSAMIREDGDRQFVGEYEIVGELGRGAMGVVYRVRDPHRNEICALKLLLAGSLASDRQVERFIREAEITSRLSHPSIVPIYDLGTVDGNPYFTMQFVEGQSLSSLIKRRKLGLRKSVVMARELARGLHYAHSRNVVHRDIKPPNILVDADGKPKITDFGLARELDEDNRLTRSGAVIGTPYYMAPEQVEGRKDVGSSADIYALGVVLYEMLTFRLPFKARSQIELSRMILKDSPQKPSASEPAIDYKLDAIVLKALAKDPADRYEESGDFADDLDAWLAGEPVRATAGAGVASRLMHSNLGIAIGAVALVIAGMGLSAVLFGGNGDPIPVVTGPSGTTGGTTGAGDTGGEVEPPPKTLNLDELRRKALALLEEARAERRKAGRAEDGTTYRNALRAAEYKLDEAIKTDMGLTDALVERGLVLRRLGDDERATKDLEAAGNHPRALYSLASMAARSKRDGDEDLDAALNPMRRLSVLDGDSPYIHLATAFLRFVEMKNPKSALTLIDEVLGRNPSHIDTLLLKGYIEGASGDAEAALRSYRAVLDLEPSHPSALGNLAVSLMEANDADGAMRYARKLAEIDPKAPLSWSVQGNLLANQGDFLGALRKFRRYLELRPKDTNVLLGYARLQAREKNYDVAVDHIHKVLTEDDQNSEAWLALADVYRRQGRRLDHDKTMDRALRAIKDPEAQAEIFSRYGSRLLSRKANESAKRVAEERLRRKPGDSAAYDLLGRLAVDEGRVEDARDAWVKAAQAKPNDLSLHNNVFYSSLQMKDAAGMAKHIRTMLRQNSSSADARALAAKFYLISGKTVEGSRELEAALKLDPENAEALLLKAELALQESNLAEYERLLSRVLSNRKAPKKLQARAHTMLASALLKKNQQQQALNAVRRAMALDSTSPQTVGLYCRLMFLAQNFREAYQACVMGAKRGLRSPDIYEILGRLELQQKKPDKAAAALQQAIKLEPRNPIGHFLMAVALRGMGRTDEALRAAKQAQALAPDMPEIKKLVAELTGG